jgi:hypothetical protein
MGNTTRTIRLDKLDAREPSWLWEGYLLRQAVNLVVGRRGIGKTMFSSWLCAEASRGGWGKPLRVYVDTREDDPRIDYRPRIEAAGGDMARIETRQLGAEPWTFPQDLDAVRAYLAERKRRGCALDLLLLDSLSAFVPRVSQPEKAAEALEGLTFIALDFDCAFVFVHHFLKSLGRSIEAAVGGAGAVQRIARTISLVGEEPRDPLEAMLRRLRGEHGEHGEHAAADVRIFAMHKLNVAATPPSLRFTMDVVSLPTVEHVPVLRVAGECEHSDEAVFEQAKSVFRAEPETELEAAMQYLVEALLDGPRPSRTLFDEALAEGFSKRTMERARTKLKCERIPPATLRERLGKEAYAKLSEEEGRMWWVALPAVPDAPPEEWSA